MLGYDNTKFDEDIYSKFIMTLLIWGGKLSKKRVMEALQCLGYNPDKSQVKKNKRDPNNFSPFNCEEFIFIKSLHLNILLQ